ncbi:coiled-coil domain-containing protein [Actinoplanes sp. GCM10030250]|uniref:coiled-coil domain-containing protein n=1 Tax=Actinoplanes sp. GCM10030250 TaxID=3273376 RepID=UPI00361197B3
MAATLPRRLTALLALLAAAVSVTLVASASPAAADPEGGTKKLRNALETAAKGYDQAKTKLASSKKRQTQLTEKLKQSEASAKVLTGQVNEVANRLYQMGRISTMSLLLNSASPDNFIDRVQSLDVLAQIDSGTLAQYQEDIETSKKAKIALDAEIIEQRKQVNVMARKKREAELALAEVGGGAAGGFVSANSPAAKAAPRNSDGSWPKESCTVKDPTSSGCITPRTLHAFQEAKADGFKRYTVCFSQRSSGEHPKGRACDFSAASGTFKNEAASGGDKSYGDSLAAYFVKNADELGVMYVIWFRQIWQPSTGWRAYSVSGGPAAVHTNHVHLSML